MKSVTTLIFFTIGIVTGAQTLPIDNIVKEFNSCKTKDCQVKRSFQIAEYYLEADDLTSSQHWLNVTKELCDPKKTDTMCAFTHSLQSELFYYNGLFQFGVNEAEKVITSSLQSKDSLIISNGYFFKGINSFELGNVYYAERLLWKARYFQPRNNQKQHLRSSILNEHVYNNLAQIKLMLQQTDSAIWYNRKAYEFAKKTNSKRGIPNIEQMYGLIYLENGKKNEASNYFNKSTITATSNNYFDIVLGNYGYMMECYPINSEEIYSWFKKGLALINQKKVNVSYQVIFFKTAIKAFENSNQLENLVFAQQQLIKINKKIALSNNDYIQNITKQYLANENNLLQQELILTKSNKEKQIFYLLVAAMALISLGLWYFFKQRQTLKNKEIRTLKQDREISNLEALIDGEETERKRIAQELHDGINGDLSAIKYHLSTIDDRSVKEDDRENLLKSIDMIDNACAQVRSISHNLIPTSIRDFGLVETVSEYCAKINSANPVQLDFQYFGNPAVLPKKAETVIFRIIQELINNITKHSDATVAMVQINFHDNEMFITVEDNGVGFDAKTLKNGLGLKNIDSRVRFLNANLEIHSGKRGTSFDITIHLNTFQNDRNSYN